MIYKLVADWDEININDVVKDCQNNNIDVCFDGDRAYLYSKCGTQNTFFNIWKREIRPDHNVKSYYMEERE